MCVFLISSVPIAELLTSELIDTPVFHSLAPRGQLNTEFRYPSLLDTAQRALHFLFSPLFLTNYLNNV